MNNSHGNVLFLILIAVALFAALSYAVTSSSRSSGSGNISKEKARLIASQIEQHTVALASAVTRMTMTGGMTIDQLGFDCVGKKLTLSVDNACTDAYENWSVAPAASLRFQVFHPSAGGVSPLTPNNLGIGLKSILDEGDQGYPMVVTSVIQIHGVGSTSTTDNSGVDLVLLAPDIPKTVCEAINDKAGLSTIPVHTSANMGIFGAVTKTYVTPFVRSRNAGDSTSPEVYGKFMACMEMSSHPGKYGFYSVIKAR